ncbi:MAG TPA: hypothetical protein PL044_12090 [Clostridiales bacterium]|nr:MAG: hypothetical protein BWY37_00405 [Firmicutes bacterium ADurb.Bin262]HOU11351.1 hypothetical protein [Clostridiales bacterium]HQH63344.1 hypothetical protein [Clostridiales bacterium]HQK74499.1 hypothetical protein [Clostridiales bacterium]
MINRESSGKQFLSCIAAATACIRRADLTKAYSLIIEAMSINPDAPQPHNLLGIWYESNADGDLARRHYRAAYALDPTYKPACKNLERICTLFDNRYPDDIDYGDNHGESSLPKNVIKQNVSPST